MSSSEAYLGCFEWNQEVKVLINKETIEDLLSGMHLEDRTITKKQWYEIREAIYKSDLVSDFFDGVVEITEEVTEEKENSVHQLKRKGK